ncbi:unnamed protein product [Rotaria socialis]|nr:unnamed protein product [Rotaria socialis]CAF3448462.1 unnamed protein product [Rotaria socialis]CAF3719109.1 unnamed protein product [Rotaria socialis]CAF3726660.1 unnamed protein product [Rotaria socialis]CAF4429018.1 unnamed protein product [Rotaria socialis]
MENNKSQIMIIDVNDRQRTLSRNTKLGHISYQTELNNYLILSVLTEEENYQPTYSKSFTYKRNSTQKGGFCDPLLQKLLSRNDLQQQLRQNCYLLEMPEQIEKLTQHIEDIKQRQQLQNILWKHRKLFDLRQPPIIKVTVHHAIETGTNSLSYTPPYRISYKDEQIQREEIDKLLRQ